MVWHQPGLTPRRRAAARDDLSLLRLSPGPLDDEPAASKLSSPRPARSLAVPSLAVPTTRAARSLAASLQLPTMMAGGEGPGPVPGPARRVPPVQEVAKLDHGRQGPAGRPGRHSPPQHLRVGYT